MNHDRPELYGRLRLWNPPRPLEERGGPECQRAYGERVGGIAQDREDIGAIPKQRGVRRARGTAQRRAVAARDRGAHGVLRAARRIVQPQRQRREHQSGHARDEERLPPPEVMIDQPTHDVSERRADRDRGEEDSEYPATSLAWEVVGQERR